LYRSPHESIREFSWNTYPGAKLIEGLSSNKLAEINESIPTLAVHEVPLSLLESSTAKSCGQLYLIPLNSKLCQSNEEKCYFLILILLLSILCLSIFLFLFSLFPFNFFSVFWHPYLSMQLETAVKILLFCLLAQCFLFQTSTFPLLPLLKINRSK
jgi:hypothetical protein